MRKVEVSGTDHGRTSRVGVLAVAGLFAFAASVSAHDEFVGGRCAQRKGLIFRAVRQVPAAAIGA